MTKRGYILMEVAVGGALIAVILGTLIGTLADARVKSVAAGRDVIASQLALEKTEQQRSLGFATVGADSPVSCNSTLPNGVVENPVAAETTAVYQRTCLLGATTTTTINGVSVQCKPVTVTVSFVANTGITATNPTGTRTVTLQSQVCQ